MSATPPDTLNRLARCFSGAILLSDAMFLQEEDESFARDERGIIRPILDASVVRFFLNPRRETEFVDAFGRGREGPFAQAAEITAEILFSRETAGRQERSALITPGHMRELQDHIDHLLRLVQRQAEAVEGAETPLAADWEKLERARRLAGARQDLITTARAFADLDASRGAERDSELIAARTLLRLRNHDLLHPLWTDACATPSVMSPKANEVNEWSRRLLWALGFRAHSKRSSKSLQNDAESAAQLIAINRVAERVLPPVRFVMITADRSLFNAGVRWWERGGRDELAFFPFRHLIQFTPVLCATRRRNEDGEDENGALDTAMSALLGIGLRRRSKLPLFIPEPTLQAPGGSLADELSMVISRMFGSMIDAGALERVFSLWQTLTRESNFLYAHHIQERDTIALEVARILSTGASRSTMLGYIRDTVQQVESTNIELGLRHGIASHLAQQVSVLEAGGPARPDRGMLAMLADFSDLTGEDNLPRFLESVVSGKAMDKLHALAKAVRGTSRERAILICGCVAFWAGQWETASYHGRLAYRTCAAAEDPDPTMLSETAYFRVVSARLAVMAIEDYGRIIHELEGMADSIAAMHESAGRTGDPLALCRAQIEEALCLLTCAFALMARRPEDSCAYMAAVTTAEDLLVASGETVPHPKRGHSPGTGAVLRLERLTAMASIVCLRAAFSGSARSEVLDDYPGLAEDLAKELERAGTLAPAFYHVVVEALLEIKSRGTSAHQRHARHAASSMRSHLDRGSHMTWLDRQALERTIAGLRAIPAVS